MIKTYSFNLSKTSKASKTSKGEEGFRRFHSFDRFIGPLGFVSKFYIYENIQDYNFLYVVILYFCL